MGKKILIVDDSATVRQQVRMALEGAGFDVEEAVDGVDGKERISKSTQLAAVVCDVNMPNMDGITFVKEIKQLPNYKFTPVIMLTTESQEAKKREGQAAGAKAWVVKPFKPEVLLGAVQKLVLP